MSVRGVLFDIDGTLVDTHASMVASAAHVLQTRGLDHATAERGARVWLGDSAGRYQAYLDGELSFDEQRWLRVRDMHAALGLAAPDAAEAIQWIADYQAAQLADPPVFDDVEPCLQACAGLRLGAVSNNNGAWQRQRLGQAGLTRWIGPVVGVEDAGAAKPDPRIFLVACEALGLPPSQVVCVGDSLAADVLGARSAGLTGVWLDRSVPATSGGAVAVGPPIETDAVPRISTLAELPAAVLSVTLDAAEPV
jgi:putative hydrolase of the HAD superfamily